MRVVLMSAWLAAREGGSRLALFRSTLQDNPKTKGTHAIYIALTNSRTVLSTGICGLFFNGIWAIPQGLYPGHVLAPEIFSENFLTPCGCSIEIMSA